jgi:hypothetical protein
MTNYVPLFTAGGFSLESHKLQSLQSETIPLDHVSCAKTGDSLTTTAFTIAGVVFHIFCFQNAQGLLCCKLHNIALGL